MGSVGGLSLRLSGALRIKIEIRTARLRRLPEVVVEESAGFGFCRELADQSGFLGYHIDLGRMLA